MALFFLMASAAGVSALDITDFLDTESGAPNSSVNANTNVLPKSGANGTWVNGPNMSGELKTSTDRVRPPRGEIKIGSTVSGANVASAQSYKQKLLRSAEGNYIDYRFTSPTITKASAGVFVNFSSEGQGFQGTTWNYYDVFGMTGNSGDDFLVLNVQDTDSDPVAFTIHSNVGACSGGVEVNRADLDQWYWVTMLWDYSSGTGVARMNVYDANTWQLKGTGQCGLPSGSHHLVRVSVGRFDAHGYADRNSYFYLDDVMIDLAGKFPLVPSPSGTPGDTMPPAPPTALRVKS